MGASSYLPQCADRHQWLSLHPMEAAILEVQVRAACLEVKDVEPAAGDAHVVKLHLSEACQVG